MGGPVPSFYPDAQLFRAGRQLGVSDRPAGHQQLLPTTNLPAAERLEGEIVGLACQLPAQVVNDHLIKEEHLATDLAPMPSSASLVLLFLDFPTNGVRSFPIRLGATPGRRLHDEWRDLAVKSGKHPG